MKKLFVWVLILSCTAIGGGLRAQSQKPIVGERAPDLKIVQWIVGAAPANGKPQLIEFFHSSSRLSSDRLAILDQWASRYGGRISVVVVTREPKEKITPIFKSGNYRFSVGMDDNGKTFSAYNVQFVPFSVLIDGRGRIRWFGNPSDLTEKMIDETLLTL